MNNLRLQVERVFTGGFWQGKTWHTVEYLKGGMKHVMTMAIDYGALRVLLRDGDPDLESAMFVDAVEDSSDDVVATRSAMGPEVMFSLR